MKTPTVIFYHLLLSFLILNALTFGLKKNSYVFLLFATGRLFRKLVQQSYLLFLSDRSPSRERFPS